MVTPVVPQVDEVILAPGCDELLATEHRFGLVERDQLVWVLQLV